MDIGDYLEMAKNSKAIRQRSKRRSGDGAESVNQQAFVSLARNRARTDSRYWMLEDMLFAIPNGADTTRYHDHNGVPYSPNRGRLMREGMSPGYPDLALDWPAGKYHGLRFEFKRPEGGVMTPEQRRWAARLILAGYAWSLVSNPSQALVIAMAYIDGDFDQREYTTVAVDRLLREMKPDD